MHHFVEIFDTGSTIQKHEWGRAKRKMVVAKATYL